MKVKEKSEKAGLKLNVQKAKIMVSGPISSLQIDGETMEMVTDSIYLDSKITADNNCSHEIKRHLLLRRKVMTNLDSILKSRDITLPTKVRLVKALVFSVVMYGCESWTIKKSEGRRMTWWPWFWVNSGSWWWIGKPGMLQSRGSQRVRHDWAIELNWTEIDIIILISKKVLFKIGIKGDKLFEITISSTHLIY